MRQAMRGRGRRAWLTRTNKQTEVDTSHNLMVLSLDPDIRKGPGAGPPFLD